MGTFLDVKKTAGQKKKHKRAIYSISKLIENMLFTHLIYGQACAPTTDGVCANAFWLAATVIQYMVKVIITALKSV